MTAGRLDTRVQVRRASPGADGFGATETWGDLGLPIRAERRDVRDAERFAAGQVAATTMARFTVRWSSFTAGLLATDRLACDGREWSITGLKDVGRRDRIEITAVARSDQ